MHWTEPTTWKRVKDNAREIARRYRWRRISVFFGALTLAICLCVRFLLPESADFLPTPRIIGIIAGVMFLPLAIFIDALQTGSVVFRRKRIDVSDSFVHYFIPYEQIVSLGFERFKGKSYFYVRGVPLKGEKEVEVHVALTAKYTESDIEAYIVQKGLGRLLALPREVDTLPIRTKAPEVRFETQKMVLVVFYLFAMLFFVMPVLVGVANMHSVFAVVVLIAFIAENIAWAWLLGKGAVRKMENVQKQAEGISVRKAWALGVPYMLTIVLNPTIVFAVLHLVALPTPVVWTIAVIWQVAWMAFVFGVGRLFRHDPKQNSGT